MQMVIKTKKTGKKIRVGFFTRKHSFHQGVEFTGKMQERGILTFPEKEWNDFKNQFMNFAIIREEEL